MDTRFILFLRKKTLVLLLVLSCFSNTLLSQQSLIWLKNFGNGGYDRATDMAFDVAGNVYVLGRFEGTIDLDPGPGIFNLTSNGLSDMFITKFDASGNFIWSRGFGGSGWDIGNVVKTDIAGNVYLSGIFQNTANFYNGAPTGVNLTSKGSDDICFLKLSPNGLVIWAKSIGGSGQDFVADMVIDKNGSIFTTGSFNATVDFNPGPQKYELTSAGGWDLFVCMLDNSGSFVMASRIGDINFDTGWGIAVDNTGNIYLTGTFVGSVDFNPGQGVHYLNSAGNEDVFVLKLDPAANFVWVKQQGGSSWECASNIELDAAGNIYNSGRFMGNFDPDLDTKEDTYLAAAGGEDYFATKFDPSGNLQWVKQIGSTGNDAGTVMVDPSGNVFLAGKFSNAVDLDPGPSIYPEATGGPEGFFMSELNSSGNFICGGVIKGSGSIEGFLKLNADKIYVAGGFENTVDFNPGSGIDTITSSGLKDAFVARLSACLSAGVEETPTTTIDAVSVFPNPTTGKFKVSAGKENLVELKVFNLLGDEILSRYSKNMQEDLDLSAQPKGVYFVNMTVGENKEKIIRRIVVQ